MGTGSFVVSVWEIGREAERRKKRQIRAALVAAAATHETNNVPSDIAAAAQATLAENQVPPSRRDTILWKVLYKGVGYYLLWFVLFPLMITTLKAFLSIPPNPTDDKSR